MEISNAEQLENISALTSHSILIPKQIFKELYYKKKRRGLSRDYVFMSCKEYIMHVAS